MVYCNHSSLVILINDANYIHFYQTFRLLPIKSIEFAYFGTNIGYIICQQQNNWFIIQFEYVFTVYTLLKTVLKGFFTSTYCNRFVSLRKSVLINQFAPLTWCLYFASTGINFWGMLHMFVKQSMSKTCVDQWELVNVGAQID